MARTATQASPRLVALVLPGIPGSVPVARRHVRETLGLHGLGEFAQDAAIITSELFFPRSRSVSAPGLS